MHDPYFAVVTTSTPERQEGIQLLQQTIARIEEVIKQHGGSFKVQMAVSFYINTLVVTGVVRPVGKLTSVL